MSEAPEPPAAARAGTVPGLRYAPRLQPDARGSHRRTPFWNVPEPVKRAVWQRDDHTCRFCGFRALRHQEVLVGGGNSRDPDQMGTVCLFCHQCHHLAQVSGMQSGVLVWLPEIAQTDLHWMMRELYLARLTRHGGERARALLEVLLARREPARQRLGSDDATELGRRLQRCDDATADAAAAPLPDSAVLAGIRLLPLDRRIVRIDEVQFNQFPTVLAWWRSPDGPYPAGTPAGRRFPWLDRLEAVLLPGARTTAPHDSATATPASLAARLLEDAATFFRNVADQNPGLAGQMSSNAEVYERLAGLLRGDPLQVLDVGPGPGVGDEAPTIAALGVRLLRDAADFFAAVGAQNAPLAEQMNDNAAVYRELAERLDEDPLASIDAD